ncbi:mitochondrial FAD carrier protein Flx1p [Trichomonascus vanleenenianus]|uniref:mitochondrial FAD carrier protein Flx1p n=1 Tax=Trichomonascus vanleenenianus TaxID=2268995 RepID=UPI003EC9CDA5
MSNDTVAHAVAGAGGGVLSTVVTYPLLTLSTRAQTEAARIKKEEEDSSDPDVKKNTSALHAARQIVQREGISGLYSGLDSAVFGIAITNFIYYYFYEGTKAFFKSEILSTPQTMAAGALAGSATVFATNPIWVVNTRMTVKDGGKKMGMIETVNDLIKHDGVKGLFSGIGPALVLVINPILQYTIFEQLKNAVQRKRKLTPLDAFFLGALGKIVATSVTYPYITLKARLQVRNKSGEASSNLIQGIRRIIAAEGVSGLYKGISTKVLQSALTSAFLFFFKEQLYAVAVVLLAFLRKLRK